MYVYPGTQIHTHRGMSVCIYLQLTLEQHGSADPQGGKLPVGYSHPSLSSVLHQWIQLTGDYILGKYLLTSQLMIIQSGVVQGPTIFGNISSIIHQLVPEEMNIIQLYFIIYKSETLEGAHKKDKYQAYDLSSISVRTYLDVFVCFK